MRRLCCSIFILLLFLGTAIAQNGENPFELQGRNTTRNSLPTDSSATNVVSPISDNPFELRRNTQNKKKSYTAPSNSTKRKASTSADNNFRFGIIAFMIILLTLLVTLYRTLLQKIYRAFLNDNFLKMIHREEGSIISIPYLLLYLLFFINGGIFIFLLLRHYGQLSPALLQTLGQCILGLMAIFFLKHLVLKIIANVFPVTKEIKQYSFMIIIFSIILGLILAPINVMLAYLPEMATKSIIYLGFALIILIYAFRSLRSIFLCSKYITFYKFHFFMYLCTVEIAPVLILVKFGLTLAGIQ